MLHYLVKKSFINRNVCRYVSHKPAFAVLKRQSVIGLSKQFCVDDIMPNSCSLFTNMRSKGEGWLLGQRPLIEFVLMFTHQLRNSCVFVLFRLTHCIRFSKSGVNCP